MIDKNRYVGQSSSSRTKNTVRNIFWGFVSKIIFAIMPFISRTVIIYRMGVLYVGLGGLFSSLLSVLNLAELGFGSAITYCLYKPVAEHDDETVCKLMNFYRYCYHIVGGVVLIMGIALLPFLKYLIHGEYPEDTNLYIVYLLYLLSTFLSYEMFSYKRVLLLANQRNDVESKITTVISAIQYLGQIVLVLIFGNYYLFMIPMIAATVIGNVIIARRVDAMYPQYSKVVKADKHIFWLMRKNFGGLIFQKIGNVVLSSVDSIVISSFLGLQILAIYGNYYSIVSIVFGIVAVVSSSLKGSVGNVMVVESKEKKYGLFNTVNMLYVTMVSFVSTYYLFLIQPFMQLWVGKEWMFDLEIAVLFALYIYFFKWGDVLYVYQEAVGIWWNTRYIPFIAAMFNLVVNLVLVNIIGISGVLVSTIVSIVCIYDFGYAYFIIKDFLGIKGGMKRYIIRQVYYLFLFIVGLISCYGICYIGPQEGIMCLVYRGVLIGLMELVIFFLGLRWLPEYKEAKMHAESLFKIGLKK